MINSKAIFMFSGRFKIGHRQISNSILQLPNSVISIPTPTPNHYTDKTIIIQKWFEVHYTDSKDYL